MVAFYVSMIKAGKMALDDVPARWRERVREALEEITAVVPQEEPGEPDEGEEG